MKEEESKELLSTVREAIKNRTIEISLVPSSDFNGWVKGYTQCQNDILKLIEVMRGDD